MSDATESITIDLTHDEALVISAFFGRFQRTDQFSLRHNAEFVAFASISAQLDRILAEPFEANYANLVDAARARLSDGFEGLAPGVINEPEA